MRPHPNIIYEILSDELEEKISKIPVPTPEQAAIVEESRILIKKMQDAGKVDDLIKQL